MELRRTNRPTMTFGGVTALSERYLAVVLHVAYSSWRDASVKLDYDAVFSAIHS